MLSVTRKPIKMASQEEIEKCPEEIKKVATFYVNKKKVWYGGFYICLRREGNKALHCAVKTTE